MGTGIESKQFLVKIQERSFKVWENLNGEQRIDDVTRLVRKIPTVIFEADRENRLGHEGRSVRPEPFDPDDMREVFLQ